MNTGEEARLHRLFLAGMQPLTAANTTTLGSSRTSSMDTGMVIVLVALLCALFLAAGLNSLLGCIRSTNLSGWYSGDRVPRRTVATSSASRLTTSVLNDITMVVVASQPGIIPATDCSICLGEFLDSEKVRVLPACKHGFHVNCIDTWLLAHSSCPLCRRPLLQQAPPT